MTAHKITDREPVFPCWMYDNFREVWWRKDTFPSAAIPGTYTHWHEDQPTAPTCVPGEADEYHNLTPEAAAEHEAQPTPEAVPMWAKEAQAKAVLEAFRGWFLLHTSGENCMTTLVDVFTAMREQLEDDNEMLPMIQSVLAADRHAPPPVGEVTDSAMLQWADENVTRVICYTEPENNGDWWRVEYWHRRLDGKKHQHVTGPDFRNTLLAAMRSGREGEKS